MANTTNGGVNLAAKEICSIRPYLVPGIGAHSDKSGDILQSIDKPTLIATQNTMNIIAKRIAAHSMFCILDRETTKSFPY